MKKCCIKNCPYVYKKGDGVKLHRFPINTERRTEWIKMVNDPTLEPSTKSVLCSKHFSPDSYMRNVHGNIILKPDAIPSVFPNTDPINFPQIHQNITSPNLPDIKPSLPTTNEVLTTIDQEILNPENCHQDEENGMIELLSEENSMDLQETIEIPDEESESYCVVVNDEQDGIRSNPNKKYNEIYVQGPDGAIVAIIEEQIKDAPPVGNLAENRRFPCLLSEFCYEDLECPVKRQKFWEVTQAMRETSMAKAQRDSKYIGSLRNKIVKLQEEIHDLKQSKRILVYSYSKRKAK